MLACSLVALALAGGGGEDARKYMETTLQDDAVDAIMAAVARAAQEKVGAKLRA